MLEIEWAENELSRYEHSPWVFFSWKYGRVIPNTFVIRDRCSAKEVQHSYDSVFIFDYGMICSD